MNEGSLSRPVSPLDPITDIFTDNDANFSVLLPLNIQSTTAGLSGTANLSLDAFFSFEFEVANDPSLVEARDTLEEVVSIQRAITNSLGIISRLNALRGLTKLGAKAINGEIISTIEKATALQDIQTATSNLNLEKFIRDQERIDAIATLVRLEGKDAFFLSQNSNPINYLDFFAWMQSSALGTEIRYQEILNDPPRADFDILFGDPIVTLERSDYLFLDDTQFELYGLYLSALNSLDGYLLTVERLAGALDANDISAATLQEQKLIELVNEITKLQGLISDIYQNKVLPVLNKELDNFVFSQEEILALSAFLNDPDDITDSVLDEFQGFDSFNEFGFTSNDISGLITKTSITDEILKNPASLLPLSLFNSGFGSKEENVVPIPATLLILLLGFYCLVLVRRKNVW